MEKEITDNHLLMTYQGLLHTLGYVHPTIFTKIRTLINFKNFTAKPYRETIPEDLAGFIRYLQHKPLHSHTIQHYYADIVQFFVHLESHGLICKNPCNFYELHLIKQPKTPREIITQRQARELYRAAESPREKMILHLCYGCGLRAKELERINQEDVLRAQHLIKVPQGKNNQHRVVPMAGGMARDMDMYLHYRSRQSPLTKALLLNQKDQRLKAYTARRVLKDILQRTRISQTITLHSLRHSIATHLLENGMKCEQVQQFLGHKQLETTEGYTRISKAQLKRLK